MEKENQLEAIIALTNRRLQNSATQFIILNM